MPTNFIAVQCFQCCMMQVKQQKKSSNKWSCVICNQKQSVRKVFAQSPMARDVRKFIQSSNLSCHHSNQMQQGSQKIETLENLERPKRNDWNEYVYVDEPGPKFSCLEGDNDGLEPLVTTEMSKPMFKKPRVKDCFRNAYGPENLFKPFFRTEEMLKDAHSAHFEKVSHEISSRKSDFSNEELDRSTRWNLFKAQIQDSNRHKMETFKQQPTKGIKGPISKWTDYYRTQESANGDESGALMAQASHTIGSKGPVSKWSSFLTKEVDEDDDSLEE